MIGTINVSVGRDARGDFLEYASEIEGVRHNITRHYYEKVDKLILQNMPDDILHDLSNKISDEINRRKT